MLSNILVNSCYYTCFETRHKGILTIMAKNETTIGSLDLFVPDDADGGAALRLDALRDLLDTTDTTTLPFGEEVNNHVHTRYSFSPYAPAAVAYHARRAGLRVVGSVDHESIGAAREMKRAAGIAGMGATVGCEIRVSFAGTPFAQRRLNNPDTVGNAYIVLHGVPAGSIDALAERLSRINKAREDRNRRQVKKLNGILADAVGTLDYDAEVRSLSWASHGGSVTERHILYALAKKVYETQAREGGSVAETGRFLQERLGMTTAGTARERIQDEANPHRLYDLLGAFKSEFVPRFFIQPDDVECPPVGEITSLGRELGAIPAYAYLGDVGESPTGDKKAQHFEDEYLEDLMAALPDLGFQAVTYMPPRNTLEQLLRVQELAARNGLMEISGVDINSSRQSFHCPEVLQKEFRHLTESTWALVGHEVATAEDPRAGLFGAAGVGSLQDRVQRFARIGKESAAAGTSGS
jgi:hypothetical protein